MEHHEGEEFVNIGVGADVTIKELASIIARTVGFEGELRFDTAKPDGTPRKLLDVTRLQEMGWKPQTSLEDGIRRTYEWYVQTLT